MIRSKFNVKSDKSGRTCDGIVFDSKMEMQYYRDVVKPGLASGKIVAYEMQKKYELQPGFRRNGKAVRPVYYVADFFIVHSDGSEVVIDIKGFPTDTAKLKRKMFWYIYPDADYKWLTYKKGCWVEQK